MKHKQFLFLQTLLMSMVAGSMAFVSCSDNDEEFSKSVEYDYVDLGLPSGTLWATCNIGASNPEEYGLYFAWGEIRGYTRDTSDGHSFDWSNYKYCNGSYESITKYYSDGSFDDYYGHIKGRTIELDPSDDAAYVNWGSKWRIPSIDQMEELGDKCVWKWAKRNGVNGYTVIGPNQNSIFLPAAGSRYKNLFDDVANTYGYYWSRTLNNWYSSDASNYYFYNGIESDGHFYSGHDGRPGDRCYGYSIRPVRVSQ